MSTVVRLQLLKYIDSETPASTRVFPVITETHAICPSEVVSTSNHLKIYEKKPAVPRIIFYGCAVCLRPKHQLIILKIA
jgi:hypothetical protein